MRTLAGRFSSSYYGLAPCLSVLLGFGAACDLGARAENQPARFAVQVRQGERVSDLCARFAGRGLTTCRALQEVAGRHPLAEYQFLRPRENRLDRFEGVFRPGKYEVVLPAESLRVDPTCSVSFRNGRPRYTTGCQARRHDLQVLIAKGIVDHLVGAVARRYTPGRAPNGLTLREQMILASIVEKEAVSNKDYDRVAAVFHNRLKRKMTLGSCPTVEYALGFHRPFLLYRDLELDSPYNVYKRTGLPPTPIAFFSDAAFRAVRSPAAEELMFFVYDWTTGKLHFAAKYRDHVRFARKARANFKKTYGKKMMYKKFPGKFYEPISGNDTRVHP